MASEAEEKAIIEEEEEGSTPSNNAPGAADVRARNYLK